jgi:hypothetical protein
VLPISARSSICRTRKSDGTIDHAEPPILRRGQDLKAANCGPVCQQAGHYNGPVEARGSNNPLLHVLVVVDICAVLTRCQPIAPLDPCRW